MVKHATGIETANPLRRRARKLVLVLVLLAGLFHAWGGHDWLFGHHHRQLGEVSYSASPASDQGQRVVQAITTPLLTGSELLLVPLSYADSQRPPARTLVYLQPQFRGPDHPRPPPSSMF